MSDNNDSGIGGIGWFLAGLGIGALVGVLYAPKSGRETRDDLMLTAQEAKERAARLADQGREQFGEYIDKGKEYYEKGRTQWSQYVDKGKDFVAEQQERVGKAVDAGKQAYTATTNDTQA